MPPRQRAAVVLTELLEFSSGEAAEALGVKPATVRKLAQQGRDTLRRTLGVPQGRSEP
jgi:DNA-directed RNA polymerase specialized sigma24 family protein